MSPGLDRRPGWGRGLVYRRPLAAAAGQPEYIALQKHLLPALEAHHRIETSGWGRRTLFLIILDRPSRSIR